MEKCGNQSTTSHSQLGCPTGRGFPLGEGSYVTKCNPAGPPQEAGPSRVRALTLLLYTYIYTYDLLDKDLAHMVSDMVETNPPTNFYVDALSGHGTIHYNLNHIPLS